jgi:hypothetical protein
MKSTFQLNLVQSFNFYRVDTHNCAKCLKMFTQSFNKMTYHLAAHFLVLFRLAMM